MSNVPAPLKTLADEIMSHSAVVALTIATAESCTAARLSCLLAQAEGSAKAFAGGFVTYSKEAKTALLGVPATLLTQETAVSANVAETMARGAVRRAQASLGVAITGVTGAKPDEDGNPIGLVFCAAAREDGNTRSARFELKERRAGRARDRACQSALVLLRQMAVT